MKQTITFKQLTKFEDLEIIIKQVNCVAKPNKIIINVMLSCHGINQSFSGVCNNLEMFYDIEKSTRFKELTKNRMKIRLIQYQIVKELNEWLELCEKGQRIKSIKDWNKEMELTIQKHYKHGKPYYAETLQGLINRNNLELQMLQN